MNTNRRSNSETDRQKRDETGQVSSLVERYTFLSLEYENLKTRIEELEAEKLSLLQQLFHHRLNWQLVHTGSLEKTVDWSSTGEEMVVYFQTGEQEVDLNCRYLQEREKNVFYCQWDFSSEPLISCVGCTNPKTFIKRSHNHFIEDPDL